MLNGNQVNIHNFGSFFEPTGYAKLNRSLILEMIKQGANIRFTPCVNEREPISLDPNEVSLLKSLSHRSIQENHLVFYNFIPSYLKKDPNHYSIGLTMFECNRLPMGWEHSCNQMDEIWVPSMFNYHTFIHSGVQPQKLKVMPLGVNTNIYRPGVSPLNINGKRSFSFLIMSSSGWDARKGYDVLLQAFVEEFSEEEDVCLIIKIRASSQEEIRQQQERVNQFVHQIAGRNRSSIIFFSTTDDWNEEKIVQLYNSVNCYVLPTRGEGWNMTVMEAMATGLPVITTNWSAHLDFINHTNGYLIDVKDYQKLHAWNTELSWAEPDKDHLRSLMRHVYMNQNEAEYKGQLAKATVLSSYTWSKSAERMMDRFREILI
ncbi:glycosyltransferase family 4 protein [Cytobacillus solani]|uniref:glycosyltransferase family 4 protein n=1 Tax=Cytobacillus solani TaxID=1637975 RepID=UPI000A670860|nr:glycosyltransferase family 4 protein [Cytobacillus solani]